MLLEPVIYQRVHVRHGAEHNIPAAPAVAAVRSAEFNVFLAPEGRAAVSAVASFDVNLRLVQELHFITAVLKYALE
jgi:hypothetical protein